MEIAIAATFLVASYTFIVWCIASGLFVVANVLTGFRLVK